jgi:hypothetical protein
MNDEHYSDLDPNEQEVLRSLSNAVAYSRKAEDRTVRMLKRRGLIIGSTTSSWVRYAKLGGLVAALFVAFFLGTQYGSREETRTDRVVTPVPDYDRLDQQTSPEGSVPDETMLTAFHMGVDHPIALDSADPDEDRYTVSGKMIDP